MTPDQPLASSLPRVDIRLVLLLFAALMLTLIWATYYFRMQRAHDDAVEAAQKEAGNLARVVAEYGERILQSGKQIAHLIEYSYLQQGAAVDLSDYRRRGMLGDHVFAGMLLADENGKLLATTAPGLPDAMATRAQFAIDRNSAELLIGVPQTEGGRRILYLSRSIFDANKRYRGVLAIKLDLQYLHRFFLELAMSEHADVSLIGSDGLIRARNAADINSNGQDVNSRELFKHMQKEGRGLFKSRGLLDERIHLNAFRKLPDFPLYIVVGIDQQDALRAYHERRTRALQMAGIASLLVLGSVAYMLWLLKRLLASRAQALAAIQRQQDLLHDLASEQTRLRETSERMSAILQHAAEAIISTDRERHIESVNPAAEKMFGYSAEELLGRHIDLLIPPYLQALMLSQIESEEFSRHRKIQIESERVRSDGSIFPVDLSISEFRAGGQRKLMSIVRDISERKKMAQLQSAFVARVNDQLRGPLAEIQYALQQLHEEYDAAGDSASVAKHVVKQLLSHAEKHGQQLGLLIDDLLDLQQLEAGSMVFQASPQQLEPLLQQALADMAALAEQYGVDLTLAGEVPAVWLWLDAQRLRHVLVNLLSNACKFSARGGTVSVQANLISAQRVRIAVLDRGCGIAAEFQSRLFEKFAQEKPDQSRQGSGLGLAIARAMVLRMGGEINFQSSQGVGSTFYVELPVMQQAPLAAAS